MANFLKTLFGFLVPLVLVFSVTEFMASRWYGKYLSLPGSYHVFERKRNNVEVLFVGDSHILCCTDTGLVKNSYVLWWGARDLYYSMKIIEQNISEMPRLKTIFVDLSYFSFSNMTAFYNPKQINNYFHMGILPNVGYDYRYLSTLYSNSDILWSTFSGTLLKKAGWKEPAPVPATGFGIVRQLNSEAEFIGHAKFKLPEHSTPIRDRFKHPEFESMNQKYLEEIVASCQKNRKNLFIILPPQSSYYNQLFTYKTVFYADLKKFGDMNPGVKIYDYSDIYDDSLSYFRDSDHLNGKGASAFTRDYIHKLLTAAK